MAAAGCQLHADLTPWPSCGWRGCWSMCIAFGNWSAWPTAIFAIIGPTRRADRLSGLQLVDRAAGEGPRDSRLLLHAAANLGLGHWRAKKMRQLTDHVLCSLPFEEAWLRAGCNATFVGHPFFDEVRRQPLDAAFLDDNNARPAAWWPSCRDRARRKWLTT